VLEAAPQACTTNSPSPHCAHIEQARSSVAVHGPERKVPGAEQDVEQAEQTSAAPLVPRDVRPAPVQPHELPSAAHEAPEAAQVQVVEPFTAFELPAGHAAHAYGGDGRPTGPPVEPPGDDQPLPSTQAQAERPVCVLPAGK